MDTAISISQLAYENLLKKISRLEEMVSVLLKKVEVKARPKYGSEEWWEWSERQADEDMKNNRYTVCDSPDSLQRHLDSLK